MKHIRFYILIIAIGVVFSCVKFTELPTLTTNGATLVTLTTAASGGNITSDGGGKITARGVCYSTTASPTLSNPNTADGSGAGKFSSNLTGLSPATTYYVRAYATNSAGTAFGEEITFTTRQVVVATLTTTAASSITLTTAVSGGNITDDGGNSVSSKGVCWATNANPTTADSKTSDGAGSGIFTSIITGLQPGTTYYSRAYAVNSAGTAYGDAVPFTTARLMVPTLTTTVVTSITATTAVSGGDITDAGGGTITVRGVCWANTPGPTTANFKTTNGTGTGIFSSDLPGLLPGTTYYIRAYATNSAGTGYGNENIFTTNCETPSAATNAATGIGTTTATLNGIVNPNGSSATVTFEYGPTITYGNTVTAIPGTVTGSSNTSVSANITGLTVNTLYHFRIRVVSCGVTFYGSELPFSTIPVVPPTVSTADITSITTSTAISGGNVTDAGNGTVSARGVCWSTSLNPTISDNHTSNTSGTGIFTSNISGLLPGTTYYVRAYATNSAGTGYGNNMPFTTNVIQIPPTVTTTAISGLTPTTAVSGGNVTSAGSSAVTSRGVCWGIWPDPEVGLNTVVPGGSGTGVFISNITGLLPGTTYHVRAYAINSAGTSYGTDRTFTTPVSTLIPTVTTTAISGLFPTTAMSGGNVTSAGGSTVTSRGVCWGIWPDPEVELNTVVPGGSGIGSFTSSITGLLPGTTYHVRAFATNSDGTAYGTDISFTTPTVSGLSDIDGNTYQTIQIGTQLWMAENLKTTRYNDGTSINYITNAASWIAQTTPAYCFYENNAATYKATYGALYNWYVVDAATNGGKNVCPDGWHVPSDAEWTTLTTFLGGLSVAGGKLKESGTTDWFTPNAGATNESGFTALPGGFRDGTGAFLSWRYGADWWCSNASSSSSAWHRGLGNTVGSVDRSSYQKLYGFSVRCLGN